MPSITWEGSGGLTSFLSPLPSRFSLVVLAITQPYARCEGGVANEFVQRPGGEEAEKLAVADFMALPACLILLRLRGDCPSDPYRGLHPPGGGYLWRRLGGITGDSLGADNELVGLVVWLFGCLQWGRNYGEASLPHPARGGDLFAKMLWEDGGGLACSPAWGYPPYQRLIVFAGEQDLAMV